LTTPGLDIRLALGRVRDQVMKITGKRQEPFVYGSIGGSNMTLVPKPIEVVTSPSRASENQQSNFRRDYELAERVGTTEAWESFLSEYKSGFYVTLAQEQLRKLIAPETARAMAAAKAAEAAKAADAAKAAKAAEDAKAVQAAKAAKAAEDAKAAEAAKAAKAAEAAEAAAAKATAAATCQRRSKNASVRRSKSTSVTLARRPPTGGLFVKHQAWVGLSGGESELARRERRLL